MLDHAHDSKVEYNVDDSCNNVECLDLDGFFGHADVPLCFDGRVLKDAAAHICYAGCHNEENHDAGEHEELFVDREDASVKQQDGGLGERNAVKIQYFGGETKLQNHCY